MEADAVNYDELAVIAGQIFNPNTPVSEKDLFSGRTEQIRRVLDAIFQKGQHVIIFGERGVGKTSLANVLSAFVPNPTSQVSSIRINCDTADTFSSVWRKIFESMRLTSTNKTIGFNTIGEAKPFETANFFPHLDVAPDEVRLALLSVSQIFQPVIIIDEFDRLDKDVRRLFSDVIKNLSDHALIATVILIGVGDSVEDLVNEHQSVSRALIQVNMPRMTPEEIKAIITNATIRLGMTITPDALKQLSLLAKGLPHYAHLMGLHATRDTLDNKSLKINIDNLRVAIDKSLKDAQHSIITNYYKAIRSSKKNNLFSEVLLACAVAEVNELGEFAAQDIRNPLSQITGRYYDIPAFAQHLNDFSSDVRGNILIKSGNRRRYRYKFSDPLMQPFTIMQGIINNKIATQSLI